MRTGKISIGAARHRHISAERNRREQFLWSNREKERSTKLWGESGRVSNTERELQRESKSCSSCPRWTKLEAIGLRELKLGHEKLGKYFNIRTGIQWNRLLGRSQKLHHEDPVTWDLHTCKWGCGSSFLPQEVSSCSIFSLQLS